MSAKNISDSMCAKHEIFVKHKSRRPQEFALLLLHAVHTETISPCLNLIPFKYERVKKDTARGRIGAHQDQTARASLTSADSSLQQLAVGGGSQT